MTDETESNVIVLNPEFEVDSHMMFIPEEALETICVHTLEDGTISIETTADWYEAKSILYETLDYINELIEAGEE